MKRKIKFLWLSIATTFLMEPKLAATQSFVHGRSSHRAEEDILPTHADATRQALARSHVHLLSDTQVSLHSLGHWETRERENIDIWYSNLVLLLANDFFKERKMWFEKNRGEVMAMPPGKEKDERWRKLWNNRLIALEQAEQVHQAALNEFRRRTAQITTWKQWYLDGPATAGEKYAVDLPLETKRREVAEAQIQSLSRTMIDLRKNF